MTATPSILSTDRPALSRRALTQRLLASALASGALLSALTGCALGTPTGTTGGAEAETDSPTPEATDTAAGGAGDGTEAGTDFDLDTCLIGAWTISQREMNAYYDALEASLGSDIAIDVRGETELTFRADSYVYRPDFTLLLEVAGTEARGATSGTLSGDYTVADGIITTAHDENRLSLAVTVSGVTIDSSDELDSFLAAYPLTDAPYECGASSVTIMFQTADVDRVPVVLTPTS